jgi:hypothetical protein
MGNESGFERNGRKEMKYLILLTIAVAFVLGYLFKDSKLDVEWYDKTIGYDDED